jgi:hypothetical protein
MAGEYSRELSAKVFAGQCRLIELGFRQGGPAGFGLRRVLLVECGRGFKSDLQSIETSLRHLSSLLDIATFTLQYSCSRQLRI